MYYINISVVITSGDYTLRILLRHFDERHFDTLMTHTLRHFDDTHIDESLYFLQFVVTLHVKLVCFMLSFSRLRGRCLTMQERKTNSHHIHLGKTL